MDLSEQISNEIIKDVRVRIFDESFPRILQCLDVLEQDQLWRKPNKNSNAIGNLVLHLCGNIRQYIVSGIGGKKDIRQRSSEFADGGAITKTDLIAKMDVLLMDVSNVLDHIKPSDLVQIKNVQGFTMSVTSILIHVTEHLSYHTGQVAFYTKLLNDVDLKFYGDLDLDVRSDEN